MTENRDIHRWRTCRNAIEHLLPSTVPSTYYHPKLILIFVRVRYCLQRRTFPIILRNNCFIDFLAASEEFVKSLSCFVRVEFGLSWSDSSFWNFVPKRILTLGTYGKRRVGRRHLEVDGTELLYLLRCCILGRL